MNLVDKHIVVTGGFGSLGRAVAEAARSAGARVSCLDLAEASPPGLEGVNPCGGVDLACAESTESAFQSIREKFGRIDALVNVAGTFRWETLAGGSAETWDMLYNINLRSAVNASKAVISELPEGGRIVNIGAFGAERAAAGMGAYAASKAGVARLTEALAEELKDRRITVNAVLPSVIDTAPNRKDMPDADFDRWVAPGQLANVIVFLLSDQADAVTGALIPVLGRV